MLGCLRQRKVQEKSNKSQIESASLETVPRLSYRRFSISNNSRWPKTRQSDRSTPNRWPRLEVLTAKLAAAEKSLVEHSTGWTRFSPHLTQERAGCSAEAEGLFELQHATAVDGLNRSYRCLLNAGVAEQEAREGGSWSHPC